MKRKVIFVPGYHDGGKDMLSPKHKMWFGWLKEELKKHDVKVIVDDYPDSWLCRARYWLPFIKTLEIKYRALRI